MTSSPGAPAGGLLPVDLRCEYLVEPLGVEAASPRLSWALCSERRGQRQTAWQVLVAGSAEALAEGRGELWDSGKVESDRSVHVPYAGRRLRSRQRCFWKVRAWDADGREGPWSAAASWEMGLLRQADWRGKWISGPAPSQEQPQFRPSPVLRKVFPLGKPVRLARAYVCGLGYFELHVNGRRVGDHVLDPAFTRYDRRALYVTHDVTGHLVRGRNALGVMLGTGQYDCHTQEVWHFATAAWRDRPKVILQLHVEFEDGTARTIVSDATWRASTGPVVFDALRNGEVYDARLERPGWATAGFDDADWSPAVVVAGPGGELRSQQMPPIRVTGTIEPVAVTEPKAGVYVFDMGQAFSGWAQLAVAGPAGTKVQMRYAEKLAADGDIDQGNINAFIKSGPCQTDTYILAGAGRRCGSRASPTTASATCR